MDLSLKAAFLRKSGLSAIHPISVVCERSQLGAKRMTLSTSLQTKGRKFAYAIFAWVSPEATNLKAAVPVSEPLHAIMLAPLSWIRSR